MNKVKFLSPYSLLLIDVSRIILMNKTLLDVACETIEPKLFFKTLYFDTNFVTTRDYII